MHGLGKLNQVDRHDPDESLARTVDVGDQEERDRHHNRENRQHHEVGPEIAQANVALRIGYVPAAQPGTYE